MADLATQPETKSAKPDQAKLDGFLRAFDTAATPQQPQRALALAARRFAFIPGAMWEGEGWDEFAANMVKIEVSKVRRALRKIFNDYRANRTTVDFRPVGDADEATAETLDGLLRADAYRSNAGQSFDNAFDEGTSGGIGAFRLSNRYEDPYDPDNDHQVIDFLPIVDADQSVYFDPNSKNYDKSDAKWGCVVTAVARAAFNEEWGDDRATDWPQGTPRPFRYEWFTPDIVRVCEWYQVEEKTETRITLTNKLTGEEVKVWEGDVEADWLEDQKNAGWTRRNKDVPRKRIHKYILSGAEILSDEGLIAGSEIPIVVYYGERRFIDNQERFEGRVQRDMDSNRLLNMILSFMAESVSSMPREVPVWYPEQIAGHENDWARANIDRLPYLTINPIYNEDGTLAQQAGPVYKTTPPELPPQMAALLQAVTAFLDEDSQDGADEVVANTSHEAMDLAATRTDEKSSGYMDNWKLTMEWAGKVYLGMVKETYVEEDRKVPQLTEDGEHGEATLLQPDTDEQGRFRIINDFTQGRFNVIADVTESSQTKRDKTVRKALGVAQIAGAETPLGQAALITAVANMDGDGMDDFKKFTRKLGLQQGVFQPTDQEQQEMAQAAQQQQGQPDPAETVLLAQAARFSAAADLDKAKAGTEQTNSILKLADARLKTAQAEAVGGPDAAPEVPTGLDHVTTAVDAADKLAGADLKRAQAAHLMEQMQDKKIRRGHEILMDHAGHALDVRAQEHAESQPANDKAAA